MSAYQVAARKYRPQRFQEVVGQPHVTAILRKAVQSGRVAHAYLFSGPRGVGKTSVARILAKAVNCSHRSPEGEPCNACPSCLDVVSGRSLNIIEIDAASNNSVEDVRLLREQVRIPPQYGPYKVYIVDEVHMLSNAAFNALLKTLEEPPPYVLFIFATTEPQKVLPTILSRCQRFGFRRIGTADIVDHLRAVCAQEGVEADDKVLHLIARRSEGSLRDALSLLDQSISLCGAQLQYDELVQALGVVHAEYFFRATDLVRKRDVAEAFGLVDELFQHGVDPTEFLQGLAEHLRHVLVARIMGGDTRLIEASEADRARYAELARELREADLYRMLRIVSDTEQTLKGHPQPRLKLEWALVRLASLERTVELEELIARIDKLERRLTGTPRGAAPSSSDASSPLPAPEPRSTPKPSATAPDPATPEPIRPPFGPPALGAKAFPSPLIRPHPWRVTQPAKSRPQRRRRSRTWRRSSRPGVILCAMCVRIPCDWPRY